MLFPYCKTLGLKVLFSTVMTGLKDLTKFILTGKGSLKQTAQSMLIGAITMGL